MYNELDIMRAYTAGFFDGEGYIGLRFRSKSANGIGGIDLNIEVVNKVKEPILFLNELYGGNLTERVPSRGRCLHYRFCINSEKAYNFLIKILPYLKVKKQQAINAIKAYSSTSPEEQRLLCEMNYNIKALEGKGDKNVG